MINYCQLARKALEAKLLGKAEPLELPAESRRAACFVTILDADSQLRGCIGTLEPCKENLLLEIADNAVAAGTRDPRFPPVSLEELPLLHFEVSLLAPPQAIASKAELDPRRYGVIVQSGYRRGVLLPDLAGVELVDQQIAIASRKAGIRPDQPVNLFRFEVEKFHE